MTLAELVVQLPEAQTGLQAQGMLHPQWRLLLQLLNLAAVRSSFTHQGCQLQPDVAHASQRCQQR